ncbi:hypothetical protein OUZ56_019959 [Daphnia magna]|uniref:Uncharacterized protein n=1 Tax=Daphnia magna TaxID=35525 RepID=A0ABQ9ZD54_9CRUS|nr:hypothetical protein OUZ56_019959 [Daphnia magna]
MYVNPSLKVVLFQPGAYNPTKTKVMNHYSHADFHDCHPRQDHDCIDHLKARFKVWKVEQQHFPKAIFITSLCDCTTHTGFVYLKFVAPLALISKTNHFELPATSVLVCSHYRKVH